MLYRQKRYEIVENVALEYLKSEPNAVEIREYLANYDNSKLNINTLRVYTGA